MATTSNGKKALIAIFSTLLLEVIFIQQPLYATVDTGRLSRHPLEQQRTTNLNTKPIEPTIRVWTANKVLTSIVQKISPWVSHSYNCLYQLRINIETIHIDSSPDGGLRGHSHMYLAFAYRSLPPLLLGARPHALFSLTVNIVSSAVLWDIKSFLCSQLRFLLVGGEHFASMW